MQAIYATLIKELHKYAKNNQWERCVLGLSGGLDSTVALCIAVRAFGPKNVTALILPEIGLTSNEDIDQARLIAKHFGCESFYQPINNFLVDFSFVPWEKGEKATQNLKPGMRSTLINLYAESQNALFIGTANKSDLLLNFGSKRGEFSGDIHIIGDLFKTEVIELAEFIGLPEELLNKPHSKGLRIRQSDLDDLGASWAKTDEIISQLKSNIDPQSLIEKGMAALLVHKIVRLLDESRSQSYKCIELSAIPESIKKAQAAEAQTLV
jgi:NAD+ synthase